MKTLFERSYNKFHLPMISTQSTVRRFENHGNSKNETIAQIDFQIPETCGLNNRRESRLIGGKTTEFNEYPWAVALLYKGHYFCGGTLINERYVLTAAHCIRGANKNNIKVLVGEHIRSFPIETKTKYYDVVYIVYHHLFNKTTYNNDIGLVKIKGKITFMWYARPACLPMPKLHFTFDLNNLINLINWDEWVPESRVLKLNDQNITRQRDLQKAHEASLTLMKFICRNIKMCND
ncbi:Serine protease 27 [Armadillidium vulgare]|nr:Serine protease 27 [Armadillidium vulgare]